MYLVYGEAIKNMAEKNTSGEDFIFSRVVVGEANRVWILAEDSEKSKRGISNSKLLQFKDSKWIYRSIPWDAGALCGTVTPNVEVQVIGVYGQILKGTTTGFAGESIGNYADRPMKIGILRDAKIIDGNTYIVGMGRQIYKKDGLTWQALDKDLLAVKDEIVGFNSIDGIDERDIYVTGMGGEIWHYNSVRWEAIDSPTNVILNRAKCVSPDLIYLCGNAGVILSGSNQTFKVIEQSETDDNLFGLEWFNDVLYVSSLTQLYTLNGNSLEKVDLKLEDDFTFGALDANDGVMWSVGARHMAYTRDGKSWTQVFYN